ncbi:hypothetical protein J2Z50_004849 [Ensifer mexicanus]|nr:hypothetical protein [Sinorhizobium mexicanum]
MLYWKCSTVILAKRRNAPLGSSRPPTSPALNRNRLTGSKANYQRLYAPRPTNRRSTPRKNDRNPSFNSKRRQFETNALIRLGKFPFLSGDNFLQSVLRTQYVFPILRNRSKSQNLVEHLAFHSIVPAPQTSKRIITAPLWSSQFPRKPSLARCSSVSANLWSTMLRERRTGSALSLYWCPPRCWRKTLHAL